jgi:phage terminase small subunit
MKQNGPSRTFATPEAGSIVDTGEGDPSLMLTPQESIFAQHYVESRNFFAAYRSAYPTDGASNSTSYRRAREVLQRPHVMAAVQLLRDQANAETLIRATDLMRDLVDIVSANPNDIVSIERNNCRHCHGANHGAQWIDAGELARAMDAFIKQQKLWDSTPVKKRGKMQQPKAPDASGGFGFVMKRDPAPDCPYCMGEGHAREVLRDTTRLSPQARKLYKGVRMTAAGPVIEMHDQMQARDMLIKMLGAYKDPKQVAPPSAGGTGALEMPENVTPEDAQRKYLSLIKS